MGYKNFKNSSKYLNVYSYILLKVRENELEKNPRKHSNKN